MPKKTRGSRALQLAQEAFSTAKSLEGRLALVEDMTGLNGLVLDRSPAGLISLYDLTERELSREELDSHLHLQEWASILFAIDETYLHLAAAHLYLDEPWRPLFEHTQQILLAHQNRPPGRVAKPLRAAVQHLHLSLEHLRRVAFLYCSLVHDGATAARIFLATGKAPRKSTMIERIVNNLLN